MRFDHLMERGSLTRSNIPEQREHKIADISLDRHSEISPQLLPGRCCGSETRAPCLPWLYKIPSFSHQSLTVPRHVKPNDMKTNQVIFIPGVGVFILAR